MLRGSTGQQVATEEVSYLTAFGQSNCVDVAAVGLVSDDDAATPALLRLASSDGLLDDDVGSASGIVACQCSTFYSTRTYLSTKIKMKMKEEEKEKDKGRYEMRGEMQER